MRVTAYREDVSDPAGTWPSESVDTLASRRGALHSRLPSDSRISMFFAESVHWPDSVDDVNEESPAKARMLLRRALSI